MPAKKAREKVLDYNFRLLGEMLRSGPWNRLALTVRWLKPELVELKFPEDRRPPDHMPIVRGPVKAVKKKKVKKGQGHETENEEDESLICAICIENCLIEDRVQCSSSRCRTVTHLECLAEHFRKSDPEKSKFFLPLRGRCPVCEMCLLWGEIVKRKKLRDEARCGKKSDGDEVNGDGEDADLGEGDEDQDEGDGEDEGEEEDDIL